MVRLNETEMDHLVSVILSDDRLFQYVMKLISQRVQPQSLSEDGDWALQVIDLTILRAFQDVRIGDMVRSIVKEMGLDRRDNRDNRESRESRDTGGREREREKERERHSSQHTTQAHNNLSHNSSHSHNHTHNSAQHTTHSHNSSHHTHHTHHHTHAPLQDSQSEIRKEVERQKQQQREKEKEREREKEKKRERDRERERQPLSRQSAFSRLPSLSPSPSPSPCDSVGDSDTPSHASAFSPSLSASSPHSTHSTHSAHSQGEIHSAGEEDNEEDDVRPNFSFTEPEPVSFTDTRRRVKQLNRQQALSAPTTTTATTTTTTTAIATAGNNSKKKGGRNGTNSSNSSSSGSTIDNNISAHHVNYDTLTSTQSAVLRLSERDAANSLLEQRERARDKGMHIDTDTDAHRGNTQGVLSIEVDEREEVFSAGESERQNASFVSGSDASTVRMTVVPPTVLTHAHTHTHNARDREKERSRYSAVDNSEDAEESERVTHTHMQTFSQQVARSGRSSPGKPVPGQRRGGFEMDLHVDVNDDDDDYHHDYDREEEKEKDAKKVGERDGLTPLSTLTMSSTSNEHYVVTSLDMETHTNTHTDTQTGTLASAAEHHVRDSLDLQDDEPVRDWERKVLRQLQNEREKENDDGDSGDKDHEHERSASREETNKNQSTTNKTKSGDEKYERDHEREEEKGKNSKEEQDSDEEYADDYEQVSESSPLRMERRYQQQEEDEEVFKPVISMDHDEFRYMRDLDDPLSPSPRPHQPLYFDQTTFDSEVDRLTEGKPVRRVTFSADVVADVYYRDKTSPSEKSDLFYTHEEETSFCRAQSREYEKADAMGLSWLQYMEQRDDHDATLEDALEDTADDEHDLSYGYEMEGFEDEDFVHDVEHYYHDDEEVARKSPSHFHSRSSIQFSDDLPDFEVGDDDEHDHDESSNF